jgi:outer membrane protein TolC
LGKYRSGVREARSRQEAARQARHQRENTLEAELKLALYRYRDAERKLGLYRRTLGPLAQSALHVARQAWEAGEVEFVELIDAQRLLLEFQLEAERAAADRAQRLAEIEMMVGREVTRSMKSEPDTTMPKPSAQLTRP